MYGKRLYISAWSPAARPRPVNIGTYILMIVVPVSGSLSRVG